MRLWCRRGALGRYSSERTAFGAPGDAFERGLRTTWGAFLASAVPQEGLEALFCGRTHEIHVICVFHTPPPLSPWPGRLFFVPGGSFSCPHTGFGVILPPGVFFPPVECFLIPGQGGALFFVALWIFFFPGLGRVAVLPGGLFFALWLFVLSRRLRFFALCLFFLSRCRGKARKGVKGGKRLPLEETAQPRRRLKFISDELCEGCEIQRHARPAS